RTLGSDVATNVGGGAGVDCASSFTPAPGASLGASAGREATPIATDPSLVFVAVAAFASGTASRARPTQAAPPIAASANAASAPIAITLVRDLLFGATAAGGRMLSGASSSASDGGSLAATAASTDGAVAFGSA